MLPSAISRTLKGLEERGYVERNINKNDRRNTYVELTAAGRTSDRGSKADHGGLRQICDVTGG